MSVLYRGECFIAYKEDGGQLISNGDRLEAKGGTASRSADGCREAKGIMRKVAIVNHQQGDESLKGFHISTTRDFSVAEKFATSGEMSEGVVFVLDEGIFEKYGVESYQLSNSHDTGESEVTIKAKKKGAIPHQVILGVIKVGPRT